MWFETILIPHIQFTYCLTAFLIVITTDHMTNGGGGGGYD